MRNKTQMWRNNYGHIYVFFNKKKLVVKDNRKNAEYTEKDSLLKEVDWKIKQRRKGREKLYRRSF